MGPGYSRDGHQQGHRTAHGQLALAQNPHSDHVRNRLSFQPEKRQPTPAHKHVFLGNPRLSLLQFGAESMGISLQARFSPTEQAIPSFGVHSSCFTRAETRYFVTFFRSLSLMSQTSILSASAAGHGSDGLLCPFLLGPSTCSSASPSITIFGNLAVVHLSSKPFTSAIGPEMNCCPVEVC